MEVLEKEMELAAQVEEAAQSLILIDIINVIIVVINIITVFFYCCCFPCHYDHWSHFRAFLEKLLF